MRRMYALLLLVFLAPLAAEVHRHPPGKEVPHDRYIRAVPESESPVEQVYIRSKDGLYIAAAIRKPKGPGPFPVLVYFHGAPGGRGMEKLVTWARGDTGSPVWERFLKDGYAVVVADYRNDSSPRDALAEDRVTNIDDGMSVLEYVRALPYADKRRIALYGVSRGGHVVVHMLTRTQVAAAVLGAPAVASFFGIASTREPNPKFDHDLARRKAASIQTPILILIGTADSLIRFNEPLHETLAAAGKKVRMDVYEGGYHDFCIGPQGHAGRKEPLLTSTLEALEVTVQFLKENVR